ncbi:MAG: terpene cyclase/mutase family protein [Planctomycetaceae bacterium]|nr:terpene cyclase/mutase family protein [Planctomycetaceae bacterium]
MVSGSATSLWAIQETAAVDAKEYQQVVTKAVSFLKAEGQAEDGSFSGKAGTGPTSLVVAGLLSVGQTANDPIVAKALKFLESNVREDGGIYAENSRHKNYETSIAVVCLSKANNDGRFDAILKKADKFLRNLQWDEGEGKSESDMEYGGAGYDSKGRPDLSNTAFFIEALKSAGAGEDDEAIQRALKFVSRCQNLENESNDAPVSAKVNDGGFFYTIGGGGESKAGGDTTAGLRSYGSMTYAGLKSMIYAGVNKDDKRVKAALEFLKKNYDLETNPGMGKSGLFYYYHTMSKALDALGESNFVDAKGASHEWKKELFAELKKSQQPNGSWVNTDSRWMEGDPNLVTGYVLLALGYCK